MVTGFADMPREETTLLLMNRSPLQPPRLLFFWKPANESSKEPPKHFGLPEGLHGGPIPEHAQGGDYARLVPLPHYNPVCHRSRGWLHLFFLSLSSSIYYYHEIQEKSRRKLYFWVCERETLFVPIYRADPVYIHTYCMQRRIEGRAVVPSPPPGPLRVGRRPPPEQITIFLFLIFTKMFKITHYEDDGN